MKGTFQLQQALGGALGMPFTAGPSRRFVHSLAHAATSRRPPNATPIARSPSTPTRRLSSTPPRRSDRYEEYSDTPSFYTRPTSSKSQKPWYLSPTTLMLGFIPIFTFGLGYWQIKRLKWKVSLIEELEDKLSRDPLRLPRNINLDVLPEFDFRLVSVRGSFDHSRTMLVGPRVRDGVVGYHVVVPFSRDQGGGMVLINRGFVSEKHIVTTEEGKRLKQEAMPEGEVEFVALLPRIYPANLFTPNNVPEKGTWFHVNPSQMAEWASNKAGIRALSLAPTESVHKQDDTDPYTPTAGVAESVKSMLSGNSESQAERVLPVYLEEVFDGNVGEAAKRVSQGIPVGRAATIELRNQHAVYAATWFSLSACTAIMFGLLVRRGRS